MVTGVSSAEKRAATSPSKATDITVGGIDNEFVDGGCKDTIFIFARGTTENINMGEIVGPRTIQALKTSLGSTKVEIQDYAASMLDVVSAWMMS
ncbi:hypothetical protein BJ878DRAFT_543633 [Calycina marina]|uniref:cutinase n=1 Tax=Calycina marina TaxID=1763456 RepID=A0A9P7Z086_9HELO|nr:hypothetical protein BJ878DRAFT_543633 [Calycina marina]